MKQQDIDIQKELEKRNEKHKILHFCIFERRICKKDDQSTTENTTNVERNNHMKPFQITYTYPGKPLKLTDEERASGMRRKFEECENTTIVECKDEIAARAFWERNKRKGEQFVKIVQGKYVATCRDCTLDFGVIEKEDIGKVSCPGCGSLDTFLKQS